MKNQEVKKEMFDMIAGWQQSDVSQKEYCDKQGIRYHVFHYWYKRYRSSKDVNSDSGFLPLQIKPPERLVTSAGIELLLAGGHRILFNHPVTADFIKAIIN